MTDASRSLRHFGAHPAWALLAALAIPIPAAAAARLFQQPFLYADASKVGAFNQAGDVNGDGKMDLLQSSGGTMTVLLGDGDVNFSPIQTLTFSQDAALGDVNGDTKPDLVTTTLVKLNNGDGTFGPEHAMLGSGSMVHLQDLTADGKLDLVAVTSFDIRVTAGNGDGTFAAFTYPFPIPGTPVSLTLADLNADGKPDALVGSTGKISVFLGTGSAATWFQPRVDLTTGANPQSVAVGDLNEDGKVDLAVASPQDPTGLIHYGNGDGTFGAATPVASSTVSYVLIADFNGDGHQDLAFQGSTNTMTEFFAGNGNGTFAAKTSWDLGGSGPYQLVHADNNATWDILWGNAVLLGNGDGTFGFVRTASTGANPRHSAIGDMNGDGFQDVVNVNTSAASVTVALGNGDGTLGATATYATDTNPQNVVVKDVNGDGRLDILTANSSPGSVSVLLALAGGGFAAHADMPFPGPNPTPQDLKAEDLNGDGKPDLVIGRSGSGGLLSSWLGVGNGTFTFKSDFNTTGLVSEVQLVDVNGDGKLDVVIADDAFSIHLADVNIQLGDGTGGFVTPHAYNTGNATNGGMVVGDYNQDGKLDVVRTNRLMLGNGDGTLQATQIVVPNLTGTELAAADFDRDGKLDIAAASGGNAVVIVYGDGAGNFPRYEYLGSGLGTVGVEAAFMNPGAEPDLVVCNASEAKVAVLLSTATPPVAVSPPPAGPLAIRGYPNPAQSSYRISFQLARGAPVVLSILDATGRRVRTMHSGTLPAGLHTSGWDLADQGGRRVAAGVYFCELRVADQVTRSRFAVLR